MPVLTSYPGASAIHPGFTRPGESPQASYPKPATSGQTEIAPVCWMYFWAEVEPSNRVCDAL
jgi:hypothetical protein